MKELKKREHTVMGQVEYKQYLAPKFHQEPVCLLHCPVPLSNERTLWVPCLVMTLVIQQTKHRDQTQKFHQLPFLSEPNPQTDRCYTYFQKNHPNKIN